MKKHLLLFLFLLIIFSGKTNAQWAILTVEADSLITLGADYIYNVEFDNAENCFKKVIKMHPEHPAGYFLDAMVEWWRIAMYRNNEKFDKAFLSKIDKVLKICDNVLVKYPNDIGALFFKGGALGYRGRYWVNRKSWFKAANDGYEAFNILLKCQETAPQNHDIMLGTGIYNYFAVKLPESYPGLQSLMLFAPRGDKALGIFQLEACARQARYAAVEAKVVLMQIFQEFEDRSDKGEPIAEELNKKYPNNSFFHRYLGRSYVSNGNLDLWEKTWRDILLRYINNQSGYDDITAREALYYVAYALMQKQKYDLALKYFYKCDEASRKVDKEMSGFMVQTNLKIGRIYDIQGKRELAITQYKKVLSWKDIGNSHRDAQLHIDTPYRK